MTTPASGLIGISNGSVEVGQAATWPDSLDFLNGVTLPAIRPGQPNLNSLHNLTYYVNTAKGNCNTNPVPTAVVYTGGNIGPVNCTNVVVNCANCDAQAWLQGNCNCACTYNCTQKADQYYNCNCNCNCNCFWSDDRLKERGTNIENALDKVNALNGFYYTGNAVAGELHLKQELDIGVSAQEIEKILPQALGDMMGDYKTVRYERIVPLLIEAIKELNIKLDSK